jgi:hypothetical protein
MDAAMLLKTIVPFIGRYLARYTSGDNGFEQPALISFSQILNSHDF